MVAAAHVWGDREGMGSLNVCPPKVRKVPVPCLWNFRRLDLQRSRERVVKQEGQRQVLRCCLRGKLLPQESASFVLVPGGVAWDCKFTVPQVGEYCCFLVSRG